MAEGTAACCRMLGVGFVELRPPKSDGRRMWHCAPCGDTLLPGRTQGGEGRGGPST